jgi:hypothetical protein
MKTLLMHPDRDFDLHHHGPPHERDLTQDLAVDTLVSAMAANDTVLFDVARTALLSGLQNDRDTILYRQEVLKDCLKNPAVVRELYALAVEAIDRKRKSYFGVFGRYPSGILHGSLQVLELLIRICGQLTTIAASHAGRFESRGFRTLFEMLQHEVSDAYVAEVQHHLTDLRFKAGILLSAELGQGNTGTNYVLRQSRGKRTTWLERLLGKEPPGYTFRIPDRDEAGARALSALQDRGLNLVANAVAQAADHVVAFFEMLRTELAFYVGCLNLYDTLTPLGVPISFPRLESTGTRQLHFRGLCDVSLALSMGQGVVGNTVDADGKSLVIITGANEGGKSSFLRSLGLAQLMMHGGMFVAAESFVAELCTGLCTHYKREEDATMEKGKLDEELSRMSDLVDAITPNTILLFNESFAATNEREGSEIARQVVCALLEKRVKIIFVTHLYEFAHRFFAKGIDEARFLRAERRADGTRTFRLVPGEPLETSYGEDMYQIFVPRMKDQPLSSK